MKIDRLIGIILLLSRNEKMTATQLAERFEVSRRTILRDVDTLCQAGLPLVTLSGGGGGISLMEDSRLDKNMMSAQELQQVLDGLGALQSVSSNAALENLVSKLGHSGSVESIAIDLGDYHKDSLSDKIEVLRRAVQRKKQVQFYYYSPKGEGKRIVEPYRVFFQWSSWYLQAWCLERNGLRMFKLDRMCDLREEVTGFVPRDIPAQGELVEQVFRDDFPVEIIFSPDMAYKIVEMFGAESYEHLPDGNLYYYGAYSNRRHLLSWVLSFGSKAQVLSPDDLCMEVRQEAEKILALYGR